MGVCSMDPTWREKKQPGYLGSGAELTNFRPLFTLSEPQFTYL